MTSMTYVKYELLRTFRNKRAFFFTLAFPLILFLVFGLTNKNAKIDLGSGRQITFILYYMVAMAGYGAMIGALSIGARIAAEREVGWQRQLRLTPLSPRTYFRAKVLTTYALCLTSIAVLFVVGLLFGAHIDTVAHLFETVGLILLALLPFIGLGVAAGHLFTSDSMGPAMGGGAALFALVGGIWFPLTGALDTIGKYTPGYWIAQASHVGIGEKPWGALGWTVEITWTVAMAAFAMWAFRRDTQRV
ncbi:MAG: type transport system permease protein [Pseudonocardiales bacterium]|nr:type transport system permease protein [Pseudonocardiales bacterium]